MIFESLFPVVAMLLFGNLLKRFGFIDTAFLKTSDRLIYFIFFPVLLFWKIGGAGAATIFDVNLGIAAVCAMLVVYLLSTAAIQIFRISAFQAGSFSQSCYRFNTYIGMAIVMNALGETGIRLFGILVGIVIPLLNVLAVSTLIWFSDQTFSPRARVRHTLKALISNPLILSCGVGILYAKTVGYLPAFVDNTFSLASSVTLPLALISIGSTLNFKMLRGHFRVSAIAAGFKLVLLPLLGYLFCRLLGVTGTPLAVGMLYFTLPTSTSIYVLSAQLFSDTELASAAIALSTVLSFFSLSLALALF